jgi:hypothetical protein
MTGSIFTRLLSCRRTGGSLSHFRQVVEGFDRVMDFSPSQIGFYGFQNTFARSGTEADKIERVMTKGYDFCRQ